MDGSGYWMITGVALPINLHQI